MKKRLATLMSGGALWSSAFFFLCSSVTYVFSMIYDLRCDVCHLSLLFHFCSKACWRWRV